MSKTFNPNDVVVVTRPVPDSTDGKFNTKPAKVLEAGTLGLVLECWDEEATAKNETLIDIKVTANNDIGNIWTVWPSDIENLGALND